MSKTIEQLRTDNVVLREALEYVLNQQRPNEKLAMEWGGYALDRDTTHKVTTALSSTTDYENYVVVEVDAYTDLVQQVNDLENKVVVDEGEWNTLCDLYSDMQHYIKRFDSIRGDK